MARIPAATRDTVPEDQQAEFDRMVEALGAVPPYGPGSVMIHVPKAHQLATALNDYLRRDSSLSDKVLELSMLVTARETDCQHIWNAHASGGPRRWRAGRGRRRAPGPQGPASISRRRSGGDQLRP